MIIRSPALFNIGFTIQSHRLYAFAINAFVVATDLMIQDFTTSAVVVAKGGFLVIQSAAGLSGSSAVASSVNISVLSGTVNNDSGTIWVLAIPCTGAVAGGFTLGIAGYSQGSPYSAGALLAETTYTMAHLDAAKGAGTGFGGGTARIDCFAVMNG